MNESNIESVNSPVKSATKSTKAKVSELTKNAEKAATAVDDGQPNADAHCSACDKKNILCREGDEATDYKNPQNPYNAIDRLWNGLLARATLGVSPAGIAKVYFNWWGHWLLSPGKQLESATKAVKKTNKALEYVWQAAVPGKSAECIAPLMQDKRFSHQEWQQWPFNAIYQTFLLMQQWLHVTVTDVRGVPESDNRIVSFISRQTLDVVSPSNGFWTNPEVLRATYDQQGKNLINGFLNWQDDAKRTLWGMPPKGTEQFQVGKHVAITPGKIIFRNSLMEVIQYAPMTPTVYKEPVLIIPAWIMKYYILDLSPENSLVRYLVEQGHTVFMISWKNPTAADSEVSFDDYRTKGVLSAIEQVNKACPNEKVHAVGYCLGGTLLMIAAASLAHQNNNQIATLTLLAAQADFSEPGELGLFIGESEIAFLESMMELQGYLDTKQMIGAFQLLRSNDLVWSRMVREYLLGHRMVMNDLMSWNADLTRMPYKMHSQYLRKLYLHNQLARGQYMIEKKPIVIEDIRCPIFCVGTQTDHVAPWKSVYKLHHLCSSELTFLLTSGGHNAGIVSPPNHPRRSYQVSTHRPEQRFIDPDTWLEQTPQQQGSWWSEWQRWIVQRSVTEKVPAPVSDANELLSNDNCLSDYAPGRYVFDR